MQKIEKHFHFPSANVIVGSFAFNFGYQQVIRPREEINNLIKVNFLILIADIINVSVITGLQVAPSTKPLKIQVMKGLSSNGMNQY